MVRDYLNALKIKGNFTASDIAKMSGIPEATIRKILSGETPDPRFETVAKLVAAMGGTLDDAFSTKKEKDIEANAITSLKSGYEMRIEDLKEHMASIRRDKKMLAVVSVVLMAILVLILVFDIAVGSHGWITY
jgi:transcriptional regulator with XRE-family HTH domain